MSLIHDLRPCLSRRGEKLRPGVPLLRIGNGLWSLNLVLLSDARSVLRLRADAYSIILPCCPRPSHVTALLTVHRPGPSTWACLHPQLTAMASQQANPENL